MDCWLQVSNEDSDSATTLDCRYGDTRWVGSHAFCEFWLNGFLYMGMGMWVRGEVVLLAPWMHVGWQEALDGAEWLAARPGRLIPWYSLWTGGLVDARGDLDVSEKKKPRAPNEIRCPDRPASNLSCVPEKVRVI